VRKPQVKNGELHKSSVQWKKHEEDRKVQRGSRGAVKGKLAQLEGKSTTDWVRMRKSEAYMRGGVTGMIRPV